LAQFKDFCVIALIISAAISVAAAILHHTGDYLDSIIIVGIVFVNALVGVIQEGRAEKSLNALRKLSAPQAEVLRGGKRSKINAETLIPGDIIFVESGDLAPADALLLESTQLTTQEAALTGESMPCAKQAGILLAEKTPLAERKNMLLASTIVLTGHAKAVVTATGMNSQIGKIAGMLQNEQAPMTPLQKRLEKVGKQLGIGAMVISALVFLLGFIQKMPILDSFMLAVSLAVAAIPEGLPAMVTVVLSLGVQRMAKQNAIVRRLPAVETLGCASVICSDKTGTLTQNKMQVPLVHDKKSGDSSGIWCPGQSDNIAQTRCVRLAALCCNAEIEGGRREIVRGEPTEAAIVDAASRLRVAVMQDRAAFKRLHEEPFNSTRKRMHVVVQFPQGQNALLLGRYMIVKGAPDVLLARCSHCEVNGQVVALDAQRKIEIVSQNEAMASRALRVIAVAIKPCAENRLPGAYIDSGLTFIGLIGMYDPPRKEAKQAVKTCLRAGITPIMITGDHIATASAIAKEIGLFPESSIYATGETALVGAEIDNLDDEALANALKTVRVIARATPEHKLRIVKLLRAQKQVVAMTGDGVNDAPALKAADIGCAMGLSGTEVAKSAADMVLTDDNFATIVRAVEQGRGIYDNIKKAVHFLISSNIGEIVVVFFAAIIGMPPPLLPIQLLWVNVVTDSAPAIALGTEKTDKHIMLRAPKPVEEHFWNGAMGFHMAVEGLLMGAVTLLAFVLGQHMLGGFNDLPLGRTMAFTVLSFVEIAHANNKRSERSLFAIGPFSNSRMNFANLLCVGLQMLTISVPALCGVFGTVMMNLHQWVAVIGLSLVPTFVMEIEKLAQSILREHGRKKAASGKKIA
jgi:Ca2+-transporting ATPase